LSMALVGTGFSYAAGQRAAQAEILTGLLPAVRDIRRIGSCALDLCMVAAGQLDGYYESNVNLWDWAAGALIAAEAGAVVRLPAAGDAPGLVIAAGPGIVVELADTLRRLGAA
jgi:myo-inositol-1(or 4)-monophosphatase